MSAPREDVTSDALLGILDRWLPSIPSAHRDHIRAVGTDLGAGYVTAAHEVLPDATLVIDRFHVARHYRDAVDGVRTQELKRLRASLPEEEQELRKPTRWPSRTRRDALDAAAKARLDALRARSPDLAPAIDLRDERTRIFDTARSNADGLRRIRVWRERVRQRGLTCFAAFLSLRDTGQDLITNYVIDYQTRGLVEGLNTTLKVRKRAAPGCALSVACSRAGRVLAKATDASVRGTPLPTTCGPGHGNSWRAL